MVQRLNPAAMTITAGFIDGRIDRATAVREIQTYALLSPEQAVKSVDAMSYFRSYGVNYGAGEAVVRAWIEGPDATPALQWKRLATLLSEPTTPADVGAR